MSKMLTPVTLFLHGFVQMLFFWFPLAMKFLPIKPVASVSFSSIYLRWIMKAVRNKLLLIPLEMRVATHLKQCPSVIDRNISFTAFVIQVL